jgi:hypothetical protein
LAQRVDGLGELAGAAERLLARVMAELLGLEEANLVTVWQLSESGSMTEPRVVVAHREHLW